MGSGIFYCTFPVTLQFAKKTKPVVCLHSGLYSEAGSVQQKVVCCCWGPECSVLNRVWNYAIMLLVDDHRSCRTLHRAGFTSRLSETLSESLPTNNNKHINRTHLVPNTL